MVYTKHASARKQQRSIPDVVVEIFQKYGSTQYSFDGSKKYFLNKNARKKIRAHIGHHMFKTFREQYDDVYLLMNGDVLVTTGYITKHMKRH